MQSQAVSGPLSASTQQLCGAFSRFAGQRPARVPAATSRSSAPAGVIGRRAVLVRAAAAVEAPATKLSGINLWNGDKRLQTQVLPVAANTVGIRCLDWDRDRFDIEFGLQNGTTYNAYLIFGEDKTALVDASHEKFRDLFMKTLKEQLATVGRGIDYVFCSHTEPDHSGLVPDVVELFPEAVVCGSKVCLTFLSNLVHRPFKQQAVKGGDKIDLGGGHVLEFVMAPNLHWPDTMFTFDHATGVMYTCDAFGMHYCTEEAFDTELETLLPHYRFYYDCLMKPNARSVLTALRKVKDLEFTTVAVGHGPLLRYNMRDMVGKYKTWSEGISKAPTNVLVLYSSDYGFSDRLSQSVAAGITKAGVAVEMMDMISADPQELVEQVGQANGVVLMAWPSDSDEAKATLSTLLSAIKPAQKVIVAESYGGKDEPVDGIVAALLRVENDPVLAPLRVKDQPCESVYKMYEEAGTDLAQVLTQKDVIAKKKGAMSPEVAKALARVSGGLYVVTAAHDGYRSAMIASWVAQASFEPLGLTIAVAKDRAIESLMQVGDCFVLNCLEEGNYQGLMKHFLKRFDAGADRFEGVSWNPAPGNGCPVLNDSLAYMECRVVRRMETPDHWITYAEVTDGNVANMDRKTAVHRRKVANYY